jgi:hypothetical protein
VYEIVKLKFFKFCLQKKIFFQKNKHNHDIYGLLVAELKLIFKFVAGYLNPNIIELLNFKV